MLSKYWLWLLLLAAPVLATPQRLITLTPHLTELVYAIGAGDRLVATDDWSDYPPEVKRLPKVANFRSINSEALLAQRPELILAWRSVQSSMLSPVTALGVPVFYSDPTRFESLADEMRALGKQLGVETQANQAADAFLARLASLRQRYGHHAGPKVRVFYQLWYPPLTSASGVAWAAQAIELCGGENIMANSSAPYPQVGMEEVLARNPQLILAGTHHSEELDHWRKWPNLDAVKQHHLVLINPDELHRFTPRALNAVEAICKAIDAVRHR